MVICFGSLLVTGSGCEETTPKASPGVRQSFDVKPSGLLGPKGAPWTLECLKFRGSYSESMATEYAKVLQMTEGVRADDVVVMARNAEEHTIYYGTYFRETDPETGRRSTPQAMVRDRQLIKSLAMMVDGTNKFPFLQTRAVRLPLPDVGPAEWRLDRVDAKYSLQVAAFEPTDEFWDYKEAAVAYCRLLRDRDYEAYFHHGGGASIVSVGAFGADALTFPSKGLPILNPRIRRMREEDELLRYTRLNGQIYSARSSDGSRMVKVESRLVEIPTKPLAEFGQ